VEPFTGELMGELDEITIFPAKHAVTTEEKIKNAIGQIRAELDERCEQLQSMGKIVEAHRLRSRTEYDIEILLETGYTSGIENYVRYIGTGVASRDS
jgi:excinuclease ABC subunit B